MNTTVRARMKAKYSAPPDSASSRDSPDSRTLLPEGRTSFPRAWSESITSPRVNPGATLADSVEERTRS
jgi:hypothetical protein